MKKFLTHTILFRICRFRYLIAQSPQIKQYVIFSADCISKSGATALDWTIGEKESGETVPKSIDQLMRAKLILGTIRNILVT
jgi:hypothetical protein